MYVFVKEINKMRDRQTDETQMRRKDKETQRHDTDTERNTIRDN